MSDWALVYVLSVMDGVSGAGKFFGVAFLILAVGGKVVGAVSDSEAEDDLHSERWRESARRTSKRASRAVGIGAPAAAICLALGTLVPAKRELIEAYVMVQASKVATADNAQKAVDGAMKRIDALIERLGK